MGHEVSSVAEEDQHGKCVAENEFAKAGDEEQNAAEPYTGTCCCNTESTRATPVHWKLLATRSNCSIGDHSLKAIERGNKPTLKPKRAMGVGLAKVVRRSPVTAVLGPRYNFSKASGDKVMVLCKAFLNSSWLRGRSSLSPWLLWTCSLDWEDIVTE